MRHILISIFLALASCTAPECHTDSECLALCPPADLQCDGGPY
jgi:hypothetical protein